MLFCKLVFSRRTCLGPGATSRSSRSSTRVTVSPVLRLYATMDMSTRQKLAALIQRDIDQLREKAEGRSAHEYAHTAARPAEQQGLARQPPLLAPPAAVQPSWPSLPRLAAQLCCTWPLRCQ